MVIHSRAITGPVSPSHRDDHFDQDDDDCDDHFDEDAQITDEKNYPGGDSYKSNISWCCKRGLEAARGDNKNVFDQMAEGGETFSRSILWFKNDLRLERGAAFYIGRRQTSSYHRV